MLYIICYKTFFTLFFMLGLHYGNKYLKLSFFIIAIAFCFIFSGFRHNFGTDYKQYLSMFNEIQNKVLVNYEPLFVMMLSLFDDYNLFLAITTLLTIGLLIYSLKNYENMSSVFPLFMLNYFGNIHGSIRYGLLIGLVLLYFELVYRKKYLISLVVLSVMILIHYASIILILAILSSFLGKLKWRYLFIYAIFITCAGITNISQEFIYNTFALLKQTLPSGIFFNKIESYTRLGFHSMTTGIPFTTIIKKIFILFVIFTLYKKLLFSENFYKLKRLKYFFIYLLIGYSILFIITPVFQTLGIRLSLWFNYLEFILILGITKNNSILINIFAYCIAVSTLLSSVFLYYANFENYDNILF